MDISIFHLGGAAFVFGLGLLFAFNNGFRNSSLIVSTVVSTRALSPSMAFALCALFEFLGTLFLGSAVVATIGQKMFGQAWANPRHEVLMVLGSALGASIVWGTLSWWRGLPTANSHALFSGLTGASWMAWGSDHLHNSTIRWIFLILILSPLIGFVLSLLMGYLIREVGEWMTPKVLPIAEKLHIVACLLVAGADGSNDGQMAIGVCVLAWGLAGGVDGGPLVVPLWVRLLVAVVVALGVLMGGRRILKKLGMSFYRIQVTQGLGAQLASAGMILTCLAHGFPVSTSQLITGSIVGAGVVKNPRAVKWPIAKDIVLSWMLTIPVVAFLAGVFYKLSFKFLGRV